MEGFGERNWVGRGIQRVCERTIVRGRGIWCLCTLATLLVAATEEEGHRGCLNQWGGGYGGFLQMFQREVTFIILLQCDKSLEGQVSQLI